MMLYIRLFLEFFKIGLFSVGGGMATVPFLYALSDKTAWFTYAQLADMIAVSESTPGPIGVNMATYVGYLSGGFGGAAVATIGLITPSVIVILLVARALKAFQKSKYVAGAFYGLRSASAALIAAALVTVAKITFFRIASFDDLSAVCGAIHWKSVVLAAALLVLTRWTPKVKMWHPIVFIALSALVGAVFRFAEV